MVYDDYDRFCDGAGVFSRLPAWASREDRQVISPRLQILVRVAGRRERNDLSDDMWTKLNIEFYEDSADAVFKSASRVALRQVEDR